MYNGTLQAEGAVGAWRHLSQARLAIVPSVGNGIAKPGGSSATVH